MVTKWFGLVLLCGYCAIAEDVDDRTSELRTIVEHHRQKAHSRLSDESPEVRSAALDALATLDCDSYLALLRKNLRLPLTDPLLRVSLTHLIGRTTEDDLEQISGIVAKAARAGDEERRDEPFIVNAAYIEFLALEVLLASGDGEAAQYAAAYLERIIERNPGPGIAQIEFALDLIGKYRVQGAVAKVNVDARKELNVAAHIALAKNGDEASLGVLRNIVATRGAGARFVFSDGRLVEQLGISPEELRSIYQAGDAMTRLAAANQLARMGRMDELHEIARRALEKVTSESVVFGIAAIGESGDESFIDVLDRIASSESVLSALYAEQAMFQIARRTSLVGTEDVGKHTPGP